MSTHTRVRSVVLVLCASEYADKRRLNKQRRDLLKLALLISSLNNTLAHSQQSRFSSVGFLYSIFFFFHSPLRFETLCSSLSSTMYEKSLLSSTVFLSVSYTSKSTFTLRFQYRFKSPSTQLHTLKRARYISRARVCAVCFIYTTHTFGSVCMYYILNYASMFYKFIRYKYCFELALHTFVRFPIAELSLEMRHAERDGDRWNE